MNLSVNSYKKKIRNNLTRAKKLREFLILEAIRWCFNITVYYQTIIRIFAAQKFNNKLLWMTFTCLPIPLSIIE